MTVLQSARPAANFDKITTRSVDGATQEFVDPASSVERSGDTDINVYFEDKLWALSECELQKLMKECLELIAIILWGPVADGGVADGPMRVDIVGDQEAKCQEHLSSTPLRNVSRVSNLGDSLNSSSGSQFERSAGVSIVINEEEVIMCEVNWSGKKKKSNNGGRGRFATSTGGLMTEVQVSEMDEIISLGPSTSRFIVPLFGWVSLGAGLRRREEVVAHGKFFTHKKNYPSHAAKTFLKDFFDLNPHTVLDLGHTTTSLSADQMIQFAQAVGVEDTLASYGPPAACCYGIV